MSRQNSIQKRLLEDATSLKKVLVDCDINGWMETSQKQTKPNKIQFKMKRIKHQSTKLMPTDNLSIINDQIERDVSYQRLLFDKKTDRNLSHQARQMKKLTLKENSLPFQGQSKTSEVKSKPFNSGYVLKELRKKVKQRNYFKKFEPEQMTKSSCVEQLSTKQSIDYFQSHFKKLLTNRSQKLSLRQ